MDLFEAKKILKNNGYLIEDTDDWDAADFVKDINYTYKCDVERKRSYNKKSDEPDYEEMAALAYEDR